MTSAANQRPVLWVYWPIRRQETGAEVTALDCGLLVCHHEPLWKSGNYLMMFLLWRWMVFKCRVWCELLPGRKVHWVRLSLISSTTEFHIRSITGKLSVLLSGHLHSFLPTLSQRQSNSIKLIATGIDNTSDQTLSPGQATGRAVCRWRSLVPGPGAPEQREETTVHRQNPARRHRVSAV